MNSIKSIALTLILISLIGSASSLLNSQEKEILPNGAIELRIYGLENENAIAMYDGIEYTGYVDHASLVCKPGMNSLIAHKEGYKSQEYTFDCSNGNQEVHIELEKL